MNNIRRIVSLTKEQDKWLKDNTISLSKFVQKAINEKRGG